MNIKKVIAPLLFFIIILILYSASDCRIYWNPDLVSIMEFSTPDKKFKYTVIPQMGRSVKMMEAALKEYKKSAGIREIELYRTTAKDWCNLGNWYNYIKNPEWKYPYMQI